MCVCGHPRAQHHTADEGYAEEHAGMGKRFGYGGDTFEDELRDAVRESRRMCDYAGYACACTGYRKART